MKQVMLWLIRFYRKYLSGMKGYSTCKYYPTCSQYGIEAIEKYGAVKGGALTSIMAVRSGHERNLQRVERNRN